MQLNMLIDPSLVQAMQDQLLITGLRPADFRAAKVASDAKRG